MNLEEIGFYTLSENRARNVSLTSPLWRCELILTSRCNFKCPYCRSLNGFKGDLDYDDAMETVRKWISGGLKNVRFSGGEPTLWRGLDGLIEFCSKSEVKRIAVSTNGSADFAFYEKLIKKGADDFSISLDACCASTGDGMSGITGYWKKVIENIEQLAKIVYISVGVVVTDKNTAELAGIVKLARKLGVKDVRLISAAQNDEIELSMKPFVGSVEPILKYRAANAVAGRNMRGLRPGDCETCWLMLDDMAVMNNAHYPCIIYLREGGAPVGSMKNKSIRDVRQDRLDFIMDRKSDVICKQNCLDVCVDYNNRVNSYRHATIKSSGSPTTPARAV